MAFLRFLANVDWVDFFTTMYTHPLGLILVGVGAAGASLLEAGWSRSALKDFVAHLAGIFLMVAVVVTVITWLQLPFTADSWLNLARAALRREYLEAVALAAVSASVLELVLRRWALARFLIHFLAFSVVLRFLD